MAIAESFKVLSEPVRRRILELLKEGRKSAGELARILEISPAALSYHLRLLRESGLIIEYKEKNFVYYSLNMTVLDEIVMWFKSFTDNMFESDAFKPSVSGSTASSACSMQGCMFESDAFKPSVSGNTASSACSMQGCKNGDVSHSAVKKI